MGGLRSQIEANPNIRKVASDKGNAASRLYAAVGKDIDKRDRDANYEDSGTITEDGKKVLRKKGSSASLVSDVDRGALSRSTGRSSTLLGG